MSVSITLLGETISKGTHDVDAVSLFRLDSPEGTSHKVRTSVRSNFYDFQCHAKVDVFHPESLSWNRIADIPYAQMRTPRALYVRNDAELSEHFKHDIEELLRQAQVILL